MQTKSKYPEIVGRDGKPLLFLSDAEFVQAMIERAADRCLARCLVEVRSIAVEGESKNFLELTVQWKRMADVAGRFLHWFEMTFQSWNYEKVVEVFDGEDVCVGVAMDAEIDYWPGKRGLTYVVRHVDGADWE
jgi:hypothetical protein